MSKHLEYSINRIAELVEGELLQKGPSEQLIQYLLIDSRKVVNAETTLFFALCGQRNNGHHFIKDLYFSGVKSFVVSQEVPFLRDCPDVHVIRVNDTLQALQMLAKAHRMHFQYPVVGITGSNGKTVVKEWLYQLLREQRNIVRSPKSYNSQVGVPISLWQMNEENDLAIFEAGISMAGEMERLQNMIKPTWGILTTLGDAHSENFKDQQQKVAEKLKLFSQAQILIYCKDYPEIQDAITKSADLLAVKKVCWSKKGNAQLIVGKIEKANNETLIQGIYKNDFLSIAIPFVDDASVENAITCWLFMLELGLSQEYIARQMHFLSPVAMRLELKEGVNNCSVINDSYNSDLGSLSIAIDFLLQQHQHQKKTIILSDILQSGKDEYTLYKQVAFLLKQKKVDKLVGIGEAISRQAGQFVLEKIFFANTQDFLASYKINMFSNETILLKGARAFGFEQISKILQQKAHETVLEINLNALIHNINYYRTLLKPETKIMAMVKAFSYGSGSFEIANILQFHRADYLAVAYADEGVELRKAGISLPIMVMNPEPQSFDAMIQYKLEPDIYSFKVLQMFTEVLNQYQLTEPLNVHLELDTGMHRLGFERDDLNEMIVRIKNNRNMKIRSVFSHFVGSEEHALDYYTQKQIKEFDEMSTLILSHFDYPIIRHLANSAGITRFPEAQFDMVRLGIGLYGVSSYDFEQRKLQNVSTLKTTISQLKTIQANDSVGYNRKGMVSRTTVSATIPIGYADGLSRKLGNGRGKVLVNGKLAPILGNVCMDMTMIDVTDIQAQEGDEVIVFGEGNSIVEVAKASETIPYEILTSVSRRVKRVYFQE